MVGRAIPSVASARQFDLQLLVPAHLRRMPLLKNTRGRVDITRLFHRGAGEPAPPSNLHTTRLTESSSSSPPPPPSHLVSTFAAAAKSSCSTLCDPIDGSPSGSTVPGILQARTLEWVAISFRRQLSHFTRK